MSSTAALKAASFALEGMLKPLIFLTNCNDAARISSPVAGGSKLKSGRMFLHIGFCFSILYGQPEVVAWFHEGYYSSILSQSAKNGKNGVSSLMVVGMRRSLPIEPLPSPADAIHPSVSLPVVCRWVSHPDLAYTGARLPGGRCN